MNTLMAIDTYAAISPFLMEMWPYYQNAQLPIVGIERTNSKTKWPHAIDILAIGEDAFLPWGSHKSTTMLPKRFIDIIDELCTNSRFSLFDSFVISEWDVAWFKPFVFKPGSELMLRKTGGKCNFFPQFKANSFFHLPWCFTRELSKMVVSEGRKMISEGDTELGSPDFFLGRLIDRLKLTWDEIYGYSFNKLDSDQRINEARNAIKNGGIFVHGVQNSEQLRKLIA